MATTIVDLEIGFNPEALRCLQDCIILIKWRSCQPLSGSEKARLGALVNNYDVDWDLRDLCIRHPWEKIGGIR